MSEFGTYVGEDWPSIKGQRVEVVERANGRIRYIAADEQNRWCFENEINFAGAGNGPLEESILPQEPPEVPPVSVPDNLPPEQHPNAEAMDATGTG